MAKGSGIVRKVDPLGRYTIPKEMLRYRDINQGDPLEIFVEEDCIILKKHDPGCAICGSKDIKIAGIGSNEKNICRACTTEIVNANIGSDLKAVTV